MGGIYIASKTKHAPKWIALRAQGVPIVSTWIDDAGYDATAGMVDLWERCVREAAHACALVVYHEPGDVLKGGFVEIGAALAHGVSVFVAGDPPGSWVHHPKVTRCVSLDAAVATAVAIANHAPDPEAGW